MNNKFAWFSASRPLRWRFVAALVVIFLLIGSLTILFFEYSTGRIVDRLGRGFAVKQDHQNLQACCLQLSFLEARFYGKALRLSRSAFGPRVSAR